MFSWNPEFLNGMIAKIFRSTAAEIIKFDPTERSNGYPPIWFRIGRFPFVLTIKGFKEDGYRIKSLCLDYAFYDPKSQDFKLTVSGIGLRIDLQREQALELPLPSVIGDPRRREILASGKESFVKPAFWFFFKMIKF